MTKYAALICYDGTNYGGWQKQPNTKTVQELLENTLSTICRTPIFITGSGRTDAGVHAAGQVAHFSCMPIASLSQLRYRCNSILPSDIRIIEILPVSDNFHARYSAKKKIYRYHLHTDPVMLPFHRLYTWHVPHAIHLEQLRDLSSLFIGTKDFSAFSNEGHQKPTHHSNIRTIYRIDIVEEPGGIRLEFEGNGFLYKMVRNITGTLMDLLTKKIRKEDMPEIFSSKDRRRAGKTAPPHGLFLMQVIYPEDGPIWESTSIKLL